MNTTQLKQISIKGYLASRGIHPKRENQYTATYLSPLREERTASFGVNLQMNLWYDHGMGVGGSIIDLVMMLEKCDFKRAAELLGADTTTPLHTPVSNVERANHIHVTGISPIISRALIDYLDERGIPLSIAQRECREVRYSIRENSREFYAIGFLNDAGGWELRNRAYKLSTPPKTITTIKRPHYRALVFEGFMDYLSYIRLQRNEHIPDNIVVLNSIVNIPKAINLLRQMDTVHAFLDRDDAGRNALKLLKAEHPNIIDQSHIYESAKDLNEFLQRIKNEPEFLAPEKAHVAAKEPRKQPRIQVKNKGRSM